MISKATAEQWNAIEQMKYEIIASITNQPSDEEIRTVVIKMWKRMGFTPTAILITDCPITGAICLAILKQLDTNSLIKGLDSQLYSQLDSQLYSQLHSQLRSQLDSQLRSQLYSQLHSQLHSQLRSQLHSQLHSQLRSQLDSQLGSQLRSQLRSQLYSQLYVSIWWKCCSGWYEGGKILGVKFNEELFTIFKQWTDCVPSVYANAGIPIVSRNPIKVHWQNGLLHNEFGKSIEFRSGWGLWNIEGLPVDEQIVMHPETQTIEQIDKEQNQDIRAIRIQRFGWPRYIKESGAIAKDERKNDIEGTLEALFQCKDGSKRLVATCPTGRIFAMGVPNEIKTCEQAQYWLGGNKKLNVIART